MKDKSGVLTYDDFASLTRVHNAISESVRLRSAPIIVRATQKPVPIDSFTVVWPAHILIIVLRFSILRYLQGIFCV